MKLKWSCGWVQNFMIKVESAHLNHIWRNPPESMMTGSLLISGLILSTDLNHLHTHSFLLFSRAVDYFTSRSASHMKFYQTRPEFFAESNLFPKVVWIFTGSVNLKLSAAKNPALSMNFKFLIFLGFDLNIIVLELETSFSNIPHFFLIIFLWQFEKVNFVNYFHF